MGAWAHGRVGACARAWVALRKEDEMALKGTHKKRIKEQMQQLGTWREEYAATVDACAKIMERQDGLLKLYKDQGNVPQTPDGKKSVTLQALEANERNLLSYLRALGLTPDTIKRMEKPKEKKATPFDALANALQGFEDE